MAAPISKDLRRRVVAAYRAGRGTYVQIAELFGIGEASVSRWLRLERETRDLEPEPHGGGFPPRISEAEYGALKALVAEKADRTVAELCDEWQRRHGTTLSRSAMQRALLKAGFTWKKNGFALRSKTVPTSGTNARRS